MGPSGCGKTTTLKMIHRLVEATSGTIEVEGVDITQVEPHVLRQGMGYVIQRIGLFPHRRVAENIATVPQLVGWSKERIRQRVDELIDVGLLFSTQPVIVEKGFVALEDDKVLIRAENIVPVLNLSIADEYGSDLTSLIDSVTAKITTDVLLELNGKVENEGLDPDAVAKDWPTSNGFL